MGKLLLPFLSLHHLLLLMIMIIRVVHGASITSCSQTPYPQVCNHFISANNTLLTIDETQTQTQTQTQFTFRNIALRVTMDQAKQAHGLISAMDYSSFDERAKLAWVDCLELYEDTVDQLNRTLVSSSNSNPSSMNKNSNDDTQTWLSAALTNHQTCQNGFIDFNYQSSQYLQSLPFMLSNFSKLLSNSLAINKVAALCHGRRLLAVDHGFPRWVSASDRKLLKSPAGKAAAEADVVVAQDGSGNYKTISEAVAASVKLRSGSDKRFVIRVKAGVYKENVEIKKKMKNLMVIGDGIDATIVTANKNVRDGSTTFRSATFAVSGNGFIAKDITFENTAGPQKHQAVAFRSGSDQSVFYSCSFKGYQDTLYLYSQRQFYRNCDIYGTIDFIFGDAVAVLQNCNIYVRKPMTNQKNTITAQARTDPNENTGIIIHNSRVTAADMGSFKTYLGRPWKKYSRTVFMKCSLDSLIDPAGWLPWRGNFALSTLYYGEYMNSGRGAHTSGRVKWPGYRVITSATEARKFTVGNFLAGDEWIPTTGVPFASGL